MTRIEQAIREAVEKGGWKPQGEEIGAYKLEYDDELSFQIERRENGYKCQRMSTYEIFLDPLFWQALGKARYYTKNTKEGSVRSKLWLHDWHRFIDHLAEGKDAESFFASLF